APRAPRPRASRWRWRSAVAPATDSVAASTVRTHPVPVGRPPMGAPLAHFAINADDVEAARHFYGHVFGWSFRAWGPPGFFQIDRDDGGPRPVIAALQQRRELVEGRPIL